MVRSSITEFPVYQGKRKGPMAATVPSLIALDITEGRPIVLKEWLERVRLVRAQLPESGDSAEILRQLREGSAVR
jgi:hypothetical protein